MCMHKPILFSLYSIFTDKKKTWTSLRLRFQRYRQTPCNHIRVKAHAIGVSIHAFTLSCFFNLANFLKARI